MSTLALIAVGGNALLRAGQQGTVTEQRVNAAITAQYIVQLLLQDYFVVLTHGNGPQVGAQLLRSEMAAEHVSPEPLDICVADTEGSIGYILEHALREELRKAGLKMPVVTVITQVVVDANDPAFQHPTKPVGPFYNQAEAQRYTVEYQWHMVEDAAHRYRRVVASPRPLEIIEIDVIRTLVHERYLVIAAGGGGIPMAQENNHFVGVEAVIDKDLASAVLASQLHASLFIITTDVDHVYLNYRQPNQQALEWVRASEMQEYANAGHFPPGSMGPKIAAALQFLRKGGHKVIITAPEHLNDAIHGKTGTHIVPDKRLARRSIAQRN